MNIRPLKVTMREMVMSFSAQHKKFDLNRRLRTFAFVWGAVAIWQLVLVFIMLRSFAADIFPFGFLSYVFSAGYLIGNLMGCQNWGPMPLSNWQWRAGVAVMLCVSGFAFFPKSGKCRLAGKIVFAALHFAGSFCTAANMASAIT
jgi:hypothetical protein